VSAAEVRTLNNNLLNLESLFLVSTADGFPEGGLPGRKWYKHVLQAPGIDTGYAASVFPTIADAIFKVDYAATSEQINLVGKKLELVAATMKQFTPYIAPGCSAWVAEHRPKVKAQQVADEAIAQAKAEARAEIREEQQQQEKRSRKQERIALA
jgi:hypothetical protein